MNVFRKMTRTERLVANNIGWILGGKTNEKPKHRRMNKKQAALLYRKPELEILESYMENRQYDGLNPWNPKLFRKTIDSRATQPKTIMPLPRMCMDIFEPHLTSEEARLSFIFDENPEATKKLKKFIGKIRFWDAFTTALPYLLGAGSVFMRLQRSNHSIIIQPYRSKFCHPVFDSSGELIEMTIRKVFRSEEKDSNDDPIYKWSQIKLLPEKDILYDTPVYDKSATVLPKFEPKQTTHHNLGFVQGSWMKSNSTMDTEDIDGSSFYDGPALDFMDSLNYRISKEDASVFYNIFAKLLAQGVDKDSIEVEDLEDRDMLTSYKPPQQASIGFLESSGNGMGIADAYDQRMFPKIQLMLHAVFFNVETVAMYAQSGKAMEILFRPVVQYIKKIRSYLKNDIVDFLQKAADLEKLGLNLEEADIKWGSLFEETLQDIQSKTSIVTGLTAGKIISRQSACEFIAPSLGIENTEEELEKIEKEAKIEMENMLDSQDDQPPPPSQNTPPPK